MKNQSSSAILFMQQDPKEDTTQRYEIVFYSQNCPDPVVNII